MNATIIEKRYKCSLALFLSDGKRFLGAMWDPQYGPSLVNELAPSFVPDFAARLAALEQMVRDRAVACGTSSQLVKAQGDAIDWLDLLSASARQAARETFARQDAILHGEFGVGRTARRDVPAIIARGVELLAACRKHEAELSAHGWGARQNNALAAAVQALDDGYQAVQVCNDQRIGLTAEQRGIANALYRQCRAIQGVARYVYPASKAPFDPTIVEARARFLLGEFPRRGRPQPDEPEAPAAPVTHPSAPSPAPANGPTTSGPVLPLSWAGM